MYAVKDNMIDNNTKFQIFRLKSFREHWWLVVSDILIEVPIFFPYYNRPKTHSTELDAFGSTVMSGADYEKHFIEEHDVSPIRRYLISSNDRNIGTEVIRSRFNSFLPQLFGFNSKRNTIYLLISQFFALLRNIPKKP